MGPPSASGRWSLVSSLTGPAVDPTIAAHAKAMQLLERYGVVPREAVLAEGVPGGFAGIYPVFKALEEQGKVRRGYFVAGLGAAQFALAGAVDRLRDQRDAGLETVTLLAATDPAQPYGAALDWPSSPGRPSRSAGAHVALVGGIPAVFIERGGRSIVTFDDVPADRWVDAIVDAVQGGRLGPLEVARIDGAAATEAPAADALLAAGFVRGYRGLVLRPRTAAASRATG